MKKASDEQRRSVQSTSWVCAVILVLSLATSCAVFQGGQEDEGHEQGQWHYEMGAGYFESQDTTYAIGELTKALEYNPDHRDAHYLLGFIYMGRRDYRRAIHHFRESLRIDPNYHFARNNLGTVYMAMERWEDAVEEFEILIEETLYTTPELAHNNIGWAYFNLGRHSEALEQLRMAIHLSPEMCLAQNNKGRVHEGRGNTIEAERFYRRAIELCPEDYQEPHFYLGKLLQRRGDANATAHFERCVQIRSRNDLAERCRQYLQLR